MKKRRKGRISSSESRRRNPGFNLIRGHYFNLPILITDLNVIGLSHPLPFSSASDSFREIRQFSLETFVHWPYSITARAGTGLGPTPKTWAWSWACTASAYSLIEPGPYFRKSLLAFWNSNWNRSQKSHKFSWNLAQTRGLFTPNCQFLKPNRLKVHPSNDLNSCLNGNSCIQHGRTAGRFIPSYR